MSEGHLHPARCSVHTKGKILYISPFPKFPFPKVREPCLMTSLQILFRFPCIFGVRHQYAVRCTDWPQQVELRSVSEAGSKTRSPVGPRRQKPLSTSKAALPVVCSFSCTLGHIFLTFSFILLWEAAWLTFLPLSQKKKKSH